MYETCVPYKIRLYGTHFPRWCKHAPFTTNTVLRESSHGRKERCNVRGDIRVHPRRSNARTRRWPGKGSGIYTFRYKFLSCPLCRGRAQHSTDTVMSPIRFYYQELGPEIKCTGTSAWTSAWSTAWSTTEGSGALRSKAVQRTSGDGGVCLLPTVSSMPRGSHIYKRSTIHFILDPGRPQTQATKNVFAEICDSRRCCHWS